MWLINWSQTFYFHSYLYLLYHLWPHLCHHVLAFHCVPGLQGSRGDCTHSRCFCPKRSALQHWPIQPEKAYKSVWERAWSSQALQQLKSKNSVWRNLMCTNIWRVFQTWHIVNLLFHWSESRCLDYLFYPNTLHITCVLYCNSILYFSLDNNQPETCYCPIHISIGFC